MNISNPHDKAFKSVMKDIKVAKEFFENHLPENIRNLVDLDTLRFKDNTYIDPKLRQFQSDLLYEVTIKNRPGFLYLLVENQSTAEQLMSFRVWQYRIGIWNDFIKAQPKEPEMLPLIITVVFYNGARPYDKPRDLRKIIEGEPELIEETLFKDFYLVDTHDIEDETLRKQVWAGIVTFAFKHAYDRDCKKAILELIDLGRALIASQGKRASSIIETLLKYNLSVANLKHLEDTLDIIQEKLIDFEGKDIMPTVAEYLRREGLMIGRQEGLQEGRLEGRQEGRQKGRQEGKSLFLLKLLQLKFGFIPENYRKKIETADTFNLG
jgi:predicted transposase/invertase (TIGR01784 family)